MRYIFDLDGTVLCSKHRQATLADGTLNLAHWIENSKPSKVLQDRLLPIAEIMKRTSQKQYSSVIVCTARVMNPADFQLLENHNLHYDVMLSRPEKCVMRDDELKEIQLRLYAQSLRITWARFTASCLMFDDAPSVINKMLEIGINCIDANQYNQTLRRKTA